MRVEGAVTAVSWIPSEAVTGGVFRMPFELNISHYDDPPPDVLPDVDEFVQQGRARFVNQLSAWIDVQDGVVVDHGQTGHGRIGFTRLDFGPVGRAFPGVPFPDLREAIPVGRTAVRFEQTCGGRTGVPAPRRVEGPHYVRFIAPNAWTKLALTLFADGRSEAELVEASPFPRHWIYGADNELTHKSAVMDFRQWSTEDAGPTPWGAADSSVLVVEAESALERLLSLHIMRAGEEPAMQRLAAGETLVEQGAEGDTLFLLLDGLLRVEVDGKAVADVGPGAVLGERAMLGSGRRTATLTAVTRCLVATTEASSVNPEVLRDLAEGHRREEESAPAPDG